jgi:hypothetical protein
MISYPVQSTARFTVYRVSTSEVIDRNRAWPRSDGSQIIGQDPDYVWLEQKENIIPDYDPRYYAAVKTETPDIANEVWQTVWSTQKRPIEDIVVAVENAERNEMERHITTEQRDKLVLLALTVLFRQVGNQALTAKEIALKDMVIQKGTTLWKNDAALRAKVAAINAGHEPDIDAGWEA